jgi:hypothetical protein
MGIVRVAPGAVGRLARVSLADVEARHREVVARRLREALWDAELRPDTGYQPTMRRRLSVLRQSVELERAAVAPSTTCYRVPEEAVSGVLARHGADK